MDSETWQTIGTIAALLAVGAYNAWRTRKAEKASAVASQHAAVAAEQTVATGNGFARDVLNRLDRIERMSSKTHDLMTEHLADHAGRDLGRP